MGQKLKKYYEKAEAIGGMKARIRLALLTRLSSISASVESDSEENIEKFDQAMKIVQKEFGKNK
jgi:hypothetical protein